MLSMQVRNTKINMWKITGKLSVIDSSGKYISLNPINDDFAIIGVQCYIKMMIRKNKIMGMSKATQLHSKER